MTDGEQKIAGMRSIDRSLDLGNDVSVAVGSQLLTEAQTALDDYNMSLAISDDKLNVFGVKEKALQAFNKKVLPAIGLQYGTDSSEYEMAGGVRESERKRPKPKTPTP